MTFTILSLHISFYDRFAGNGGYFVIVIIIIIFIFIPFLFIDVRYIYEYILKFNYFVATFATLFTSLHIKEK